VRLTTLDNIDITGLEQFHKKIRYYRSNSFLPSFSHSFITLDYTYNDDDGDGHNNNYA